jgi:hypothetical protein
MVSSYCQYRLVRGLQDAISERPKEANSDSESSEQLVNRGRQCSHSAASAGFDVVCCGALAILYLRGKRPSLHHPRHELPAPKA